MFENHAKGYYLKHNRATSENSLILNLSLCLTFKAIGKSNKYDYYFSQLRHNLWPHALSLFGESFETLRKRRILSDTP